MSTDPTAKMIELYTNSVARIEADIARCRARVFMSPSPSRWIEMIGQLEIELRVERDGLAFWSARSEAA